MKKIKKFQSIVEYTLVSAVVIAVMIIVASMIRSKLNTDFKNKAENTMTKTVQNMDKGIFSFK